MSSKQPTVKTHPLMELIASRLLGIESVPVDEQRRMLRTACRDAAEYHDSAIREAENRGAREMRERLADKMAGWAHHEIGDDGIEEAYLIAAKEPLPHSEQENDR